MVKHEYLGIGTKYGGLKISWRCLEGIERCWRTEEIEALLKSKADFIRDLGTDGYDWVPEWLSAELDPEPMKEVTKPETLPYCKRIDLPAIGRTFYYEGQHWIASWQGTKLHAYCLETGKHEAIESGSKWCYQAIEFVPGSKPKTLLYQVSVGELVSWHRVLYLNIGDGLGIRIDTGARHLIGAGEYVTSGGKGLK